MKPNRRNFSEPLFVGDGSDLKNLVSELIKRSPDPEKVKILCKKSGLRFEKDPIDMMSSVLKSINNGRARRKVKRKLDETNL